MYKFSIAICTCYFGPFPWYLHYFLHSCKFNPTIDFYIITDNTEFISNKPDNVHIINLTLEQIQNLASDKLGFKINIDRPYKLCDIKPAYGFIFSEFLRDYDFWGHGDIDLVYGCIRDFITDELLTNYEVISSRHDYITGSFCLFKNNDKMNKLFMQSKDYKIVFESPNNFCFDECNFLFLELQNGLNILEIPCQIESMTYIVKKMEAAGTLKAHFDFIIVEGTPGKIIWHNGKIIYKRQYEAMFYHLIKFKEECRNPKILNPIPDTFYFSPTKIYSKKENI